MPELAMPEPGSSRSLELHRHRTQGNEDDDVILEPSETRDVTVKHLVPKSEAQSSSIETVVKETAVPLYKDRKRRIVFAGIMIAWLFVSIFGIF
jgi:hypothetical protein